MRLIKIILLTLLVSSPVHAATYYVATTGSNSNDGSEASPWLTWKFAATQAVAGDTVLFRGGTYNQTNGQTIILGITGTSGQRITFKNYPGERPIISWPDKNNTANRILAQRSGGLPVDHITIEGFEIVGGYEGMKCQGPTICTGWEVRFNWIHNNRNQGILGQFPNFLVERNIFQHNGNFESCVSCTFEHGIYAGGNNTIIRWNEFIDNLAYGLQQQPGTGLTALDWVIHNNTFAYQNYRGGEVVAGANSSRARIENNLYYENAQNQSSSTPQGVDCANCSSVTGTIIRNNHFYATASGGTVYKQSALSATESGNVVNVSAPSFVNGPSTLPASPDLRISASSSPNVDIGRVQSGVAFCGSAPDAGAYEFPVVTGASINGNTLDVTICSAFPPIKPNGTWTLGCTGTNCGSRTVTGTTVVGGGTVRLTVSGTACEAGQTWTVSASGNNTDSINMGGLRDQSIGTITNFAVNSSACTGGGGPGFPSGNVANYDFESNLNDSSGNGNHAIGSSGVNYVSSKDGLGVQFTAGAESYVDTGLLSGFNPSTNHLVIAFGIRIADLGVRRFVAGVGIGTNQRFYIRQNSNNTWEMAIQANGSPGATEFPVTLGDQHICVKFNPGTDTATLYVNGQAGTTSGTSVQPYTSYIFDTTFRFGIPSSAFTPFPSTSTHIIDQAFIYTTDESCADIYAAWQPPVETGTIDQDAHQWQSTHTVSGSPVNIGSQSAAISSVSPGGVSLVVQYSNTSGTSVELQPRFYYNVNGGTFNNQVPDTPTSDGVYFWGVDTQQEMNNGAASATGLPIGGLSHTNGVTALLASTLPTLTVADGVSRTIRGGFRFNTDAVGKTFCFKIYDQGGQPLNSYTPSAGACVQVHGMSMGIQ